MAVRLATEITTVDKMKNAPPSIDWNLVFGKLTYSAAAWMAKKRLVLEDPMIKGQGPADLAQRAMLVVVEKYHHFIDLGSEEEILKMAHRIMWNDFLDLIRSSDYRTNDRLENLVNDNTGHESVSIKATQQRTAEDDSEKAEFYALAQGEADLIEYIEAVLVVEAYKREDIASLLGISAQEVTNRQRKLRYRYMVNKLKTDISESASKGNN